MKTAAGLLLYVERPAGVAVLLVHPSGAYNQRSPWSLPKGELDDGEAPEQAARRETLEETGVRVEGPVAPLGHVDYTRSRKRVVAFAAPLPEGAEPRCASWEIDRAELIPLDSARELLHSDQQPFLDRLLAALKA